MLKFYIAGVISVRSTHLWEKRRIQSRIRIRTSYYWIRIREAQQQVDPADPVPDPQHWRIVSLFKKNLICFVLGINHPTAGDRRFRPGNRGSHAALFLHWRSGKPWGGIICMHIQYTKQKLCRPRSKHYVGILVLTVLSGNRCGSRFVKSFWASVLTFFEYVGMRVQNPIPSHLYLC